MLLSAGLAGRTGNEADAGLSAAMLLAVPTLFALALFAFGLSHARRPSRRPRHPRAHRRRLRQLAEIANHPVAICDGERVVAVNTPLRTLLHPARTPEGRPLASLLAGWTVSRIPDGAEADATLQTPAGLIAVRLSRRAILHQNRSHTVVTVSDQRDRLRREAELQRLQHTDALTGLANRPAFQAAVATHLARPAATPLALLILGLDRFAAFNDTHGHNAGDDLLRRVAAALRPTPAGVLAAGRLGGDQFGLLLDAADPDEVHALGTTLVNMLADWLRTDGAAPGVGASAGFALAPADAADGEALSTAAELALRHAKEDAKEQNRGVCRPYRAGLAEEARERHHLELLLRQAQADNQFEVHFQPQANLRTGAFDGAEALLRWRHPERGFVEPAEFLPLAERIGLIAEIGEWVLRTACRVAAAWPAHLHVAVNLSVLQFRKHDLAETFARILADTGLPPGRLELEVTEGLLIEDEERTLETLNQLRATGVRIALDDFGTGYSSLSYLRRFPFDKIKLDKSFISKLPDDADDAAIVTSVLALANDLGIASTAEGIETEQQSAFVSDRGCTQAQGFLIGRPVPDTALPRAFHPAA